MISKQLINEIVESIDFLTGLKAEMLIEKKISSNYRACLQLNKKIEEEKENLKKKIEEAFNKSLT
jgi:hypothetical protein